MPPLNARLLQSQWNQRIQPKSENQDYFVQHMNSISK